MTEQDSKGGGGPEPRQPSPISAVAHPVRLAIIEYLSTSSTPATATELAELVGLSASATSWHLRTLAKHGLITQAEGRGDHRERLWQLVGTGVAIDYDPDPSAERADAERAYLGMACARADARLQAWLDAAPSADEAWRDGMRVSDDRLVLTPEELRELNDRYDALIEPYLQRNRTDPPAGSGEVYLHLRLVPHPGDS